MPDTGTLDIMAQAHRVLETEKMAPPIWSIPEPSTSPVPRHSVRFGLIDARGQAGHTDRAVASSLGLIYFAGKIGNIPEEVRGRGPTRRGVPVCVCHRAGDSGDSDGP